MTLGKQVNMDGEIQVRMPRITKHDLQKLVIQKRNVDLIISVTLDEDEIHDYVKIGKLELTHKYKWENLTVLVYLDEKDKSVLYKFGKLTYYKEQDDKLIMIKIYNEGTIK
jgi:hypothetical protein